MLTEDTRDEQRPSDLDGDAADAAGLELPALPPRNRDEEHRELLELPHPRPLGRVVAPRAGPSTPRAEVLLLGAEAEEEDHDRSVGGDPCCSSVRRGTAGPALAARPRTARIGLGEAQLGPAESVDTKAVQTWTRSIRAASSAGGSAGHGMLACAKNGVRLVRSRMRSQCSQGSTQLRPCHLW